MLIHIFGMAKNHQLFRDVPVAAWCLGVGIAYEATNGPFLNVTG